MLSLLNHGGMCCCARSSKIECTMYQDKKTPPRKLAVQGRSFFSLHTKKELKKIAVECSCVIESIAKSYRYDLPTQA